MNETVHSRQVTRDWIKYSPQLPISERDRRWQAIRAEMEKRAIDCLLVIGNDLSFGLGMANIRYFTQIGCRHGGFLVFPSAGDPAVFVGPPHMCIPVNPYAHSQDWVRDVYANTGVDKAIDALFERGGQVRKVGLVSGANRFQPDNIPYTLHRRIHERLAGIEVVDASDIVFNVRIIKSEAELALLRDAGPRHRKVVQAMIDASAPGVTEADVYAAMIHEQIRNGGEAEIFNFFISGSTTSPEQQNLLHGVDANMSPTMRVLEPGDALISESHFKYGGYMTQAEMTVAIGEPPVAYRKLFDAAVECFHAALPHLRPGRPIREALNAERAIMDKYGLDWVELGFHGHGLGSPEDPTAIYMGKTENTWPNGAEDTILQENMVICNNTDIFDPSFRTDVGVMYCNTIIIKDQPEVLIDLPEELPVKR